jgi:hypothetical protein
MSWIATAVFPLTNPNKENMENTTEKPGPRPKWANKVKTAEHYDVSPRTITNWKALGLIVFFQIGRVVRFDLVASDALLKEHGVI